MEEAKKVRISVRSLVEFILRSGDIDNRHGGGPMDKEAMQEGGRIHRKIQGKMGSNYKAEVPLTIEIPGEGYILTVEGRADGVIHEERIEEEKKITAEDVTIEQQMNLEEYLKVEADSEKLVNQNGQEALEKLVNQNGKNALERLTKTETSVSDHYIIDEIKGVYRDVNTLEQPLMLHLAQAKCYAYIYGSQNNLCTISVQMTYCNLETEEIKRFRETYTVEELEEWFMDIVGQYQKWAKHQIEWREIRQASIKNVEFPFPWRKGQKEVASSVYKTMLRRKKLFIQAPTGTGKTISTVFPAVKAVGEGIADRIFYATAKTITRTVAEEAYQILRRQGLHMKTLTLTAKEKICFMDEAQCNPDACPYAKGHYDRVNDAVFEMITTGEVFDRPAIEEQARKWQVCPFEFGLDVSLWADAIICDYNYIFDPRAKLKRFFGEGVKGDYLLLIDEAHNLVERGREMFSASLIKEDFLALRKAIKPYSVKMSRALSRCNTWLLEQKRDDDGSDSYDRKRGDDGSDSYDRKRDDGAVNSDDRKTGEFVKSSALQKMDNSSWLYQKRSNVRILNGVGTFPIYLMNLCGIMEEFLEDSHNAEINEKVLELYFQVRRFLDTSDNLDENYLIYTELLESGEFLIRLFCVDVSKNLQECLNRGKSTIYFSATFLPINYYKSLLSTLADDYAIYAKSTFDPQKRLVMIGTDTSSRYTNRNVREYQKMAEYVLTLIQAKRGNYMIFFSSYRMMEDVADQFALLCEEKEENIRVICQETGMREAQREEFLAQFEESHPEGLAGFCVMGGIFGEGIDLKEDRLIGAVVVGAGLPQVCNERELLKAFYDQRGEDGFFYAYLCPGMNKVLQSAGRVIRTEEDEGVILLLDERFSSSRYRQMFPEEWEQMWLCNLQNVRQKTEEFWKERAHARLENRQ